jgi:hypothetical protein
MKKPLILASIALAATHDDMDRIVAVNVAA